MTRGRPIELGEYPRKGFWSLIVTQFQGAFNDNLFQYLIIYYLMFEYGRRADGGVIRFGLWTWTPDVYVQAMATFLFSLPFILFAGIFGALSDRFSKGWVAFMTKVIEVGIMVAGGLAFWWGAPGLLLVILFFMATQSAMFGPSKYGILPEMLPEARLSWGNGIIQMGTIVAIIAGTGLAGPVFEYLKVYWNGQFYLAAFLLVGLSLLGMISGYFITRPPAANPRQPLSPNPIAQWKSLMPYLKVIWHDRVLFQVVVGYTYFWFAGALARQAILQYSTSTLGYGETRTSALLAAVALGIGLGAVFAGYMSRGKIEQGLIPIGTLGMSVIALIVATPRAVHEAWTLPFIATLLTPLRLTLPEWLTPGGDLYFAFLLVGIFLLGGFAGIFDVPLAASLQHRAPARMKGGVIAATNMLTFVGMAGSSLLYAFLGGIGVPPAGVFIALSIASLVMGAYIAMNLPLLLLRAVLWMMDGTLFRLIVRGRERLRENEPALLVANHDTLIDTLAIQAALDRDVYFVLDASGLEYRWVRRLGHFLRLIPVDTTSHQGLEAGVSAIRKALSDGHLVCVPREPILRREGLRVPWHDDYGLLTRGSQTLIHPVAMTRLWERVYIFRNNRIQWRWWGRPRYPVQVYLGEGMAADVPAWAIRKAQEHLYMEAYQERPYQYETLHEGFVSAARRNLHRIAMADSLTGALTYFKTLVGAVALARKLKPILGREENVGLLLPSTVGGALTNIAVQMMGKVPINLNYTASSEIIAGCARRADIRHVLTSRRFLERLPQLQVPEIPVYLEEIREQVTAFDRITSMLMALLLPKRLLLRVLGCGRKTEHSLATIIFSSGSEGEPKGVMLTHRNIMTIKEEAEDYFPHDRNSCVVGFLPLFHSFGYTVCVWTPLLAGVRVAYHPNPLEPRQIGQICQEHHGTIMVATATFLQGFIRRCDHAQLESLEYVVCGAEKLPERIRLAFREKFGTEPVEGYGTTECAPAVSTSLPDAESPGFYVTYLRHNTIGRPLGGQAVKVLDPDTGEPLPPGEAGMLYVKGPNIMVGYLNDPERTARVLKDGWYETGDIAAIDEDGFIRITDRLARFSKIAGEMVPHTRVEETLHGLIGATEQVLVVTGVPDVARGERLVVLHTLDDEQLDALIARIDTSDLPNLWRPRASSFYRIDAIPILGSGKLDIRAAKKMAQALDIGE